MEEPRDTTPIPDPVVQAVLALVNAQTWVESRSVMEARRDVLFDPAALRAFELLLEQYSGDAGKVEHITGRRDLLQRALAEGIDAAHAGLITAEYVQSLHRELMTLPPEEARRVDVARALLALTALDNRMQRAVLQYELATSLEHTSRGDRLAAIEEAIGLATEAAATLAEENEEGALPVVRARLASLYQRRSSLAGATDLEARLADLIRAGSALAREDEPETWARIQHNIGECYRIRRTGDPAENIEAAIRHLGRALEVFTADAHPVDSGLAENSLGAAYLQRPTGDPSANIESALEHLQRALALRPQETFPDYWAKTQANLGSAWMLRFEGERSANVANAIGALEAAMSRSGRILQPAQQAVATRQLADLHHEMANLLYDRAAGDRDADVEAAIPHYRSALRYLGDGGDAEKAAAVRSALGVALYERPGGDRAANLEEALEQQQAVLRQLGDAASHDRALAHHNLGNVYAERVRGDRAENLESAIRHFETALETFTAEDFPEDRAMTRNSLGSAWLFRIEGDRADNIETALEHFSQALQYHTREAHPRDWAMTLHNRATAFMSRIHGRRADNVEAAIRDLEASLEFRTRDALPFYWAMTQVNLGNAFLARRHGEQHTNVARAIDHFRNAQQVYTRRAFPTDWAWVEMSLGQAYAGTAGAGDTGSAVAHYESALEVYTRDQFPYRWAGVHKNLGLAHRKGARRDGAESGKAAIRHFELALEVFTPEEYPVLCRQTLSDLGDEHMLAGAWQRALDRYDEAIAVDSEVMADAWSALGRQAEAGEAAALYKHSAYALLMLDRPGDSVLRLEAGKARLLAESLAVGDADLARLPEPLRGRLRDARRSVRRLESEMGQSVEDLPQLGDDAIRRLDALFPEGSPSPDPAIKVFEIPLRQARALLAPHGLAPRLDTMLQKAREDLNALIGEARAIDPGFGLEDIDVEAVTAGIPEGGALVVPLVTGAGSAVWVLPHGTERVERHHAVELDADLAGRVEEILVGPVGRGGWLNAYLDWLEGGPAEDWHRRIEETTGELWAAIMGPVHDRLAAEGIGGGAPVALVPQAQLGLLPLHAAWRTVDGRRRAFVDDYAVQYSPSIRALAASRRRAAEPGRRRRRLLAIANPTADLAHADLEVEGLERFFEPDDRLRFGPSDGTEEAVVRSIPSYAYLHFACHGHYDWYDVLRSRLSLAGGTRLTLARVVSPDVDLERVRLVVLSACETGLIEFERAPDESVGLPGAFLEGGAPAVISTLWAVDDLSTALLMEGFYRRYLEDGLPIAAALRGAQLALRDATAAELGLVERWEAVYRDSDPPDPYAFRMMRYHRAHADAVPYASPFYWAGFHFTGA